MLTFSKSQIKKQVL